MKTYWLARPKELVCHETGTPTKSVLLVWEFSVSEHAVSFGVHFSFFALASQSVFRVANFVFKIVYGPFYVPLLFFAFSYPTRHPICIFRRSGVI